MLSYAFILLLIVLFLLVHNYMNRHSLNLVLAKYGPSQMVVSCDEDFSVQVEIENQSRLSLSYLRIQMFLQKELELAQGDFAFEKDIGSNGGYANASVWLKGHEKVVLRIPVKIKTRGRYVLSHPGLYGGDFLGISENKRVISQYREVIVAPSNLEETHLQELMGNYLGDYSVRRFLLEDQTMTLGYRDYSGLEPMKQISWTQSARCGNLMVKEYDHTLEPSLHVILNVETSMNDKEDILEVCFSIARTVCEELEIKGIPYIFSTNAAMAGTYEGNYQVREGLGEIHYRKVLECLGRATYISALSKEKLLLKRNGEIMRCIFLISPSEMDFEDSPEYSHFMAENHIYSLWGVDFMTHMEKEGETNGIYL